MQTQNISSDQTKYFQSSTLNTTKRFSNRKNNEKDIITSFWKKTPTWINQDIHNKIDLLINNKSNSTPTPSQQHIICNKIKKITKQMQLVLNEKELFDLLTKEFKQLQHTHYLLIQKHANSKRYSIKASSLVLNNQILTGASSSDTAETMTPIADIFMEKFNAPTSISFPHFIQEICTPHDAQHIIKENHVESYHCLVIPLNVNNKRKQLFAISTAFLPDHNQTRLFTQLAQQLTITIQQIHERSPRHTDYTDEDLIVNLSHDLRNSVNPLINLLPVLITSHNQHNQDKIIRIIQQNMNQINNLVQHAIQLAQLKSTQTTVSERIIDLSKETENIIESFLPQIEKKKLRLIHHLGNNMLISANLPDIKTVLTHLMKNAILYTDQGDVISITTEKNNDFIHLSINDTGIGMTQDQIQHVFDECYKADPSRHNLASHGLGLSICKHIIDKHKGSIWIESQGIQKGSSVHLTFPIIPPDKQ